MCPLCQLACPGCSLAALAMNCAAGVATAAPCGGGGFVFPSPSVPCTKSAIRSWQRVDRANKGTKCESKS